MSYQIRNLIREKMSAKQDAAVGIPAVLGDNSGVVQVPGRANYVYAIAEGQILEVYNVRVAALLHLQVIIGYDPLQPGVLQVLSARTIERAGDSSGTSRAQEHHATHEWMGNGGADGGGSDVVHVHLRQLRTLRVERGGALSVAINPGVAFTGGVWRAVASTTLDLEDYGPVTIGKALWALISIDSAGAVAVTAGSEVDITALALTDIPTRPSGHRSLAAVRLYYGQNFIAELQESTDIIDLRWTDDRDAPPGAHHASHENGGTDEISVAGLSGVLADAQNADKLQGRAVSSSAPSDGYSLVWDAATSLWTPKAGGGGGGHTIQDEGTSLTQRTKLNFVGAGVAATDDSVNDASKVTIPGVAGDPIWTAKGQIAICSASGAAAALAIGTNDKALVANSGATNGADWQYPYYPAICQGRLTLTSGTPVTTTDVTGSTVYWELMNGKYIGLYNGSGWSIVSSTTTSLNISGAAANTIYDVFGYLNGGALALEYLAWASQSARATALAFQDGILVKSGAAARRYLGTFRTNINTGTTEDSYSRRLLWNYYNRRVRPFRRASTGSVQNNNAGMRTYLNDTNNPWNFLYVIGWADTPVFIRGYTALYYFAMVNGGRMRFYMDGTNATNQFGMVSGYTGSYAGWSGSIIENGQLGYHYASFIEDPNGSNVQYGCGTPSGVEGHLEG